MIKSLIRFFSSLKLTVVCLSLLFILVLLTTLAQRYYGIYYSVSYFMTSWLITITIPGFLNDNTFPLFPGGLLVSSILLINLMTSHVSRFKYSLKKAGIWLTHISLILLIGGAAITHFTAVESQLILKEGEEKFFSEHSRFVELSILKKGVSAKDVVWRLNEAALKRTSTFTLENEGLTFKITKFIQNAELSSFTSIVNKTATIGVGPFINVNELKEETRDNFRNTVVVYLEIFDRSSQSLGICLLSNGLNATQRITINKVDYFFSIRPQRFYTPFSFYLEDFRFDKYLGTDVPKNFQSQLILNNELTKEKRQILISMNKPLRYQGRTYYQASFGENETVTVLQVVKNIAWTLPYISCLLLAIGLSLHFIISLILFIKRKSDA